MLFSEFKQSLEETLNRLQDAFESYNFEFNGLQADGLGDVEEFEMLVLDGGCTMDFDDFKRGVKKTLFTEDGDVKLSDIDWDNIQDCYEDAIKSILEFNNFKDQVEGVFDLDANIDLEKVELNDKEDIMQLLFEQALKSKKIIPIETDMGSYYISNPSPI